MQDFGDLLIDCEDELIAEFEECGVKRDPTREEITALAQDKMERALEAAELRVEEADDR